MSMHAVRGGRGFALPIFNISTRKGRVVNTMSQPLYPTGKNIGTHFMGGWGRSQCQSVGVWRKSLAPTGVQNLDHPAQSKSPHVQIGE
jgi:hypothetical protein